jgi:hypothetical protein
MTAEDFSESPAVLGGAARRARNPGQVRALEGGSVIRALPPSIYRRRPCPAPGCDKAIPRAGAKTCGARKCRRQLRLAKERTTRTRPDHAMPSGTDSGSALWYAAHGITLAVLEEHDVWRYATSDAEVIKDEFRAFYKHLV